MADTTEKIIIEVEQIGVRETNSDMEDLNKTIEENQQVTSDATGENETYDKSLTDIAKDTKIMGVSLNSMSAAFKSSVKAVKASTSGLKLFKVALASTGIGLLVIALGSLVVFFTRSQKGSDLLSKSLRIIGNVINVLLDRLSDFGGGLMKLFSGDIKGGFADMKDSFTGIGEAIQENIDRAIELEQMLIELHAASLSLVVNEANMKKAIAENREVMNDSNKTLQERFKAGEDALIQEEALANAKIFNLQLQKDYLEGQLQEGESKREDYEAVAQLEADILNAQTQRSQSSIRIRRQLQAIEKQLADEMELYHIEQADARAIRENEALLKKVKGSATAENKITLNTLSNNDFKLQGGLDLASSLAKAKEASDKRIEESDDANTAIQLANNEAIADSAQALFGGLASLAGQNTVFGKATAIAEATMNTWRGVTAVLAEPIPSIAKVGFIAATIAQGLAAVRQIASTPIPKVQTVESVFADGGHINGASHNSPSGGVRILAEGGEFVMNKRSMALPGVAGLMETINSLGSKGVSMGGVFAAGGNVQSNLEQLSLEASIQEQRTVLVVEDFMSTVNTISVSEELSTL